MKWFVADDFTSRQRADALRLVLSAMIAIAGLRCSSTSTTRLGAGGTSGSGACPAGQTECSASCVDPATNAANCGRCGRACGAGTQCVGGACVCLAGLSDCSGQCLDTASNTAHCGACDRSCGTSQACTAGDCTCPTGSLLCGSSCVDSQNDVTHCGTCTTTCGTAEQCVDGTCQCQADQTRCNGSCTGLSWDPANCGSCGHACGTGEVCTNGQCGTSCATGQTNCSGACVDPSSNSAHCGACGNACAAGQVCSAGACGCASGTTECGGRCTDTATDLSNCGSCNTTCVGGQSCTNGVCACAAGSTLCGAQCVDTRIDGLNCGACGTACPGGQVCGAGVCVCATSGQTYCASAGACVNTQTDPANCGSCGTQCASTQTCSAGACTGGTATCTGPTTTTVEAETMTHSTGGADGTVGWNIWANGFISTQHAFQAGRTSITVVARGDSAAGVWPHMVVSVNGAPIGDTTVSSATYTPYAFSFTALAGSQELRVEFDNDYNSATEDRNLYVDQVVIEDCSTGTGTGGTGGTGGTTGGTGGTTGGTGGTTGGTGGTTGGTGGTTGGTGGTTGGTGGTGGTTTGGTGGTTGGTTGGNGFYRMERLNRGVVAVQLSGAVYVGWRMYGFEYDATNPSNVAYNVYRGGTRIATVTNSTNYRDTGGSASSTYSVRAVIGGVEGASSEIAGVWAQQYLRVPLQIPAGGTTPSSCPTPNEAYTYSANDASAGDVDGDGRYEIFLKWDPSNSKDNSQSGCTGNVYLDAYTLDGTRLWRIDLGPNIRAGAHYTQFVVYDFDGDGKAELAVKTAPGTRDGTGRFLGLGPAAGDDDSAVYRNSSGYILSGPEYLSVFSGQTGAELATVNFDVPRGTVSAWGDNYGNRVDRFLATAAYLDGTGLPSFVMARGYYTRATLTAWNWRNGTLSQLWKFDSNSTPTDSAGRPYTGQGSHALSVANVDTDKSQEIVYGAMSIDNDGKGLCSSGNGHGDALHVGDLIPSRAGVEVFMCNEDGLHPAHYVRDPRTCAMIQAGPVNGADTGRCVADDVWAGSPGAEMWSSSVDGLISATTNASVGAKPGSTNFLAWWDADESRELVDRNRVDKYNGTGLTRLLTATGCSANNGTKETPALVADLFGDWREEIVWREDDSSGLRIYTTTDVTTRRIYTLMHDAQYRVAISWQNSGYNQPPHPSFQIGNGMAAPPVPDISVR